MIYETQKLTEAEELLYTVVTEQGYDDILIDNYFLLLQISRLAEYGNISCDTKIIEYNGPDKKETTLYKALGEDIYSFFVALYGEYGLLSVLVGLVKRNLLLIS